MKTKEYCVYMFRTNTTEQTNSAIEKKHKIQGTCLDAPDASAVVEGRVDLPHIIDVMHIPHVHTMVVIHTRQVAGHRVLCEGQSVRILSVRQRGEQMPVQE